MKKTAILVGALMLFIASISAQEQPWTSRPTVDSINAKYKLQEMPKPLTIEKIFPIIGRYEVTNTVDNSAVGEVVIMLDEQNKGTVWIQGLPQGRIYAQLRRSPATYKIPVQTTAEGNSVPEGTLMLDPETGQLSISVGRPYNVLQPELVFTDDKAEPGLVVTEVKAKGNKTKLKTAKIKHIIYSGQKEEQTTVMIDQN